MDCVFVCVCPQLVMSGLSFLDQGCTETSTASDTLLWLATGEFLLSILVYYTSSLPESIWETLFVKNISPSIEYQYQSTAAHMNL